MKSVEVTLLTKPGCHLCEQARETVEQVIAGERAAGLSVSLSEINILTDEKLARKHAEAIPVVLIGKKRHSFWHVDAARFAAALRRAAGR